MQEAQLLRRRISIWLDQESQPLGFGVDWALQGEIVRSVVCGAEGSASARALFEAADRVSALLTAENVFDYGAIQQELPLDDPF